MGTADEDGQSPDTAGGPCFSRHELLSPLGFPATVLGYSSNTQLTL
jgi:hypothetical protein